MVNPYRGEVALTLNGERHVMRLTLGALAGLEARMGAASLTALVQRFETGHAAATDVAALLAAGLTGGGTSMGEEEVLAADIDGGPIVAVRAAAQLLAVSFSMPRAEE